LAGGIEQLDPDKHRNLWQIPGLNHKPDAVPIIWLRGKPACDMQKEQSQYAGTHVAREYTAPARWNRHGHSDNYGCIQPEKQPTFSSKTRSPEQKGAAGGKSARQEGRCGGGCCG
jgi:hypothetical protein